MPTVQKHPLHLLLDEVEMIAYASETDPVCSFYYDDSLDSDTTLERARYIVRRINVHDALLAALELAERQLYEYCAADDGRDRDSHLALKAARRAIAQATGRAPS
jgi:hypothetical protein